MFKGDYSKSMVDLLNNFKNQNQMKDQFCVKSTLKRSQDRFDEIIRNICSFLSVNYSHILETFNSEFISFLFPDKCQVL